MIEVLFGPDGIGKSTVASQRLEGNSSLVVLHGTRLNTWAATHGEVLADAGIDSTDIPPDADFVAKICKINAVLRALAASDREVLVDGHALHKTAINVVAGLVRVQDVPADISMRALLDGQFGDFFDQLPSDSTTHTHVVLPGGAGNDPGERLQARLRQRGELTEWDPQSADASLCQVAASYLLEDALVSRGQRVEQAVATDPRV